MTDGPRTREKVALGALLFSITACFGFLQPFTPLYLQAAGLQSDEIGYVMALGALIALLLQPILGRLSDRFDARRPFIIVTTLLAGLAYTSYRFADGFWAFLALTALGVNGTLYLNAAGGVLVGRMVVASQGGAAYARYRVFGSVGYIFVGVVAGFLVRASHGPSAVYSREDLNGVFTYGPLMFLAIGLLAPFVPDRKTEAHPEPAGKAPLSANLRWFLASYLLYIGALYGASSFLSLYMNQLGGDALWVTGMFAGGVVIEVLVMLQSGRLSDRIGRRPVLLVCYALLPLRMLLYAPATGPWWVAGVQLLHGVNFGIMGVVSVALINDLATERTRGHAQGRLAAVGGLASAISPAVFGWISRAFDLRAVFITSSAIAAVGLAIFALKVQETRAEA